MTDTNFFDTSEKVDILLKQAFGFPSTSENKQWYEETAVKYNNYLIGQDLFLDKIPQIPDFDISGIVVDSNSIGINSNSFLNYSDLSSNKSNCSIVDDSTGTIRRFKNIILDQSPNLGSDIGASWLKLDNSNNNILTDAFQFNYNQYKVGSTLYQPYLYSLYTESSINTDEPDLPFGQNGGNWFFDIKSGLIFFSDFDNFSNGTQTEARYQISDSNKPVLTFYKYIGRKGIDFINSKLNTIDEQLNNVTSNNNLDSSGVIDLCNNFNSFKNLVETSFNSFNLNIQNISNTINNFQNSISYNSSNIYNLQTNINFFSNKITNLENSLNDSSNNILDLQNQIYNIKNDILINDISINNIDDQIISIKNNLLNNDFSINNIDDQIISIKNNLLNNDFSINNLITNVSKNSDLINIFDLCFNSLNNNLSNLIQKYYDLSSNFININKFLNDISYINKLQDFDISNIYEKILDISNLNNIYNLNNLLTDLSSQFNFNFNNFNNNIEQIRNEVQILNTNINENNNDIKDFKNISYDICYNIDNINNDLLNINLLINNLTSKINDISINNNNNNNNNNTNNINNINNYDLINNEEYTNFKKFINDQISVLNNRDSLIKSDINYNRSLIETNSLNNKIFDKKINVLTENIKNINELLIDLSTNPNQNNGIINNIIDDLSINILNIKNDFINENLLIKGDIYLSNNNIDYNTTKIEILESEFENLHKKYTNLFNSYENKTNNFVNDLSNIQFINNNAIYDLYIQNEFLKSDILINNNNNSYYENRINLIDELIENINKSINNLYQKTNNYNINNLYLFFKNLNITRNMYTPISIDFFSTYKNGHYNNILFNENYFNFEKLQHLLDNNSIFLEFYCTCFLNVNNDYESEENMYIKLDLSSSNFDLDNNIDQNINIGYNNISNKNQYILFGPNIFKLTKNLTNSKSIYYKNNFILSLYSNINCLVSDVKIIVKILNYK